MPRFIIKPKPDEDFYVEWSTIVDDWTKAGTREEMLEDFEEERLERADKNGSSAYPRLFHWDTEEFSLGQYPSQGHFAHVKRADLREYVTVQWNNGEPLTLTDPRLERFIHLTPFED